MEKVKVTREQADAVERLRGHHRSEMEKFKKEPYIFADWLKPLHELSVDEIDRACYEGYEIKPEFKIGDWVYVDWINKSAEKHVFKVTKLLEGKYVAIDADYVNKIPPLNIVRHATPEEIATEKTRRWWAKHDREVWELKREDVFVSDTKQAYTVKEVSDGRVRTHESARTFNVEMMGQCHKIACFAEDRKDIKK